MMGGTYINNQISAVMDRTDLRVVKLLATTLATVGDGTEKSPIRRLFQLWTMDGELLLQFDCHRPEVAA